MGIIKKMSPKFTNCFWDIYTFVIIITFIGILLFYIILSFSRIRKYDIQAEPINILVVESQLDKLLKKLKND